MTDKSSFSPERIEMSQPQTKAEVKANALPLPPPPKQALAPIKVLKVQTREEQLAEISSMYDNSKSTSKVNILIIGESGVGKTTLAETCPKPVLIDSFDPGGTRALSKDKIFVRDFSGDSIKAPTKFVEWGKQVEHDVKTGFLDGFGTYILDSATTFNSTLLNAIKNKRSNPLTREIESQGFSSNPDKPHYGIALTTFKDYIKLIAESKCNFILMAHMEIIVDPITEHFVYFMNLPGKLKIEIPILFDEVWYMRTTMKDGKLVRELVFVNDGKWKGKTRIGRDVFKTSEPAHITDLLKKAGYPTEDRTT